jgi:hypothetical protein
VQPELLGQAGRRLHVRQGAVRGHPAAAPVAMLSQTCRRHYAALSSGKGAPAEPSETGLRNTLDLAPVHQHAGTKAGIRRFKPAGVTLRSQGTTGVPCLLALRRRSQQTHLWGDVVPHYGIYM